MKDVTEEYLKESKEPLCPKCKFGLHQRFTRIDLKDWRCQVCNKYWRIP